MCGYLKIPTIINQNENNDIIDIFIIYYVQCSVYNKKGLFAE